MVKLNVNRIFTLVDCLRNLCLSNPNGQRVYLLYLRDSSGSWLLSKLNENLPSSSCYCSPDPYFSLNPHFLLNLKHSRLTYTSRTPTTSQIFPAFHLPTENHRFCPHLPCMSQDFERVTNLKIKIVSQSQLLYEIYYYSMSSNYYSIQFGVELDELNITKFYWKFREEEINQTMEVNTNKVIQRAK